MRVLFLGLKLPFDSITSQTVRLYAVPDYLKSIITVQIAVPDD